MEENKKAEVDFDFFIKTLKEFEFQYKAVKNRLEMVERVILTREKEKLMTLQELQKFFDITTTKNLRLEMTFENVQNNEKFREEFIALIKTHRVLKMKAEYNT